MGGVPLGVARGGLFYNPDPACTGVSDLLLKATPP